MKKIVFLALFSLLLVSTNSVFAQILYCRKGSIPLTGKEVTLLAAKHRGTLQWQCSSDGKEWINLEDQTSDSLKVDVVDAGYYRGEIRDESCNLLYSDTALISSNTISNETGTFLDRRDGKTYKWVKIGTQVWMAENLSYLPAVSPYSVGSATDPKYYVLAYDGTSVTSAKLTNNYSKYGVLYNWPAAVEACPSGWHLPSDNEWNTLANTLGGKSQAGFYMKTIMGWNSSLISANNSSGFTALPSGLRFSSGGFSVPSQLSGNWWAKPLVENAPNTNIWSLYPAESTLKSAQANFESGLSIRCVKDSIDVLELSITLPNGIDPNAVTLQFPKLKYNKKLVSSWTIDDNLSVWNLHCAINHKPMGIWPNFHMGETGGEPASKPLEYTDGTGIKHRFGITVGVFDWLLTYMGRDAIGTGEWVTPAELRVMQDFGSTTAFHDLKSTGNNDNTFDQMIASNGNIIASMTDRSPKVMIEPNGDHSYITNSNANDNVAVTTAQENIVTTAKPFSDGFSLNKKDICLKRVFYWSNLVPDFLSSLASQANGTIPASEKTWLIGGNHYISSSVEQNYFNEVERLYGASGNDMLWFPSLDEFYEYWFLSKNTTVTKTVKGQKVTFKFDVPTLKNFSFKDFSILLSGISDTTGVKVASSNAFNGTSYAMNEGKLLVNLNFSTDLIPKVEKYLDKFKNSLNAYDLEDAQYFVQMLKPGVREIYQDQLKQFVSGPQLNSFSINAGVGTTTSRSVILTANFKGTATHYMVSEDPAFTGASWISYVASIPVSLGNTAGAHTLYLKLKNKYDVSSVVSASIIYDKVPFALNSVLINAGDENTPSPAVKVTMNLSGDSPTHYMVSEKPLFSDATWLPFTSGIVNFTLASTPVPPCKRTVYVKVKTASETSLTKSDFINLTEPASLTSILIDSGAVKTGFLDVKVSFAYKGLPSHYMLSEVPDFKGASWASFQNPVSFRISSEFNTKTIYAKVKDVVGESVVRSSKIELIKISPIGRKIILAPVIENNDQRYDTLANRTIVNLCTTKQYEDWNNFSLKDSNGEPWATRVAKPSQLPAAFSLQMAHVGPSDPDPTKLDDTGVYPAKYLKKYFGIDGYPELSPLKRGLRIMIEPGTYTLNVLFSTGSQATYDGQASIVYEANGVRASPSGIPLNNKQTYVKLAKVIVGDNGILDFSVAQKKGVFAGFNLLEIVRAGSATVATTTVPLDSISINTGASVVNARSVSVKFYNRGTPTHYMLSELDDFSDATWQTFTGTANFKLSSGAGSKVIYAKLKDATDDSNVSTKTIEYRVLNLVGRKMVISPVPDRYLQEGYAELTDGTVINRFTSKQYETWENFTLKDTNGESWGTRIEKPSQLPDAMKSALVSEVTQLEYLSTKSADSTKLVGQAVAYPITYMRKYFGISSATRLAPKKSGFRFLLDPGTYTVRVLFSTNDLLTNKGQADMIYEANGILATPTGIPVNNPNTFIELKEVVVGADNILDFYVSQKTGVFGGFNMLEIVKSK